MATDRKQNSEILREGEKSREGKGNSLKRKETTKSQMIITDVMLLGRGLEKLSIFQMFFSLLVKRNLCFQN